MAAPKEDISTIQSITSRPNQGAIKLITVANKIALLNTPFSFI